MRNKCTKQDFYQNIEEFSKFKDITFKQ